MALPLKLDWEQAQNRWKSQLDPIIANPTTNMAIIPNIKLKIGVNVIDHRLQQMQQGWTITDIQGAATIYRSAPFNKTTLTLTSNADVTITLGVF